MGHSGGSRLTLRRVDDERSDPVAHQTGYPRTPWRYLWWLVRSQPRRIAAGATYGVAWMVGLTLPPLILARAIDDGLRARSASSVGAWAAALLVVGLVVAVLAILRHRTMTRMRIEAALQTIEATARQSVALGSSLARGATAGEITTIGVGDAWAMSQALTVTGPGVGAVVAYVVIAVALFTISPLLAVIILVGTPLVFVLLGPLLDRFRIRGGEYRDAQGALSNRIVDIVSGLRVLNTLGEKSLVADRTEEDSLAVQRAGYRLAATESWIRGISVGLPAVFLAVIVWIAARLAAQDAISIGQLVAVYGYVAVTVVPIANFVEGAVDINRALVSARRAVDFLAISTTSSGDEPIHDSGAELSDPASGVRLVPGHFDVLVSADRADAIAILDRLGGVEPSEARWGEQCLSEIEPAALGRAILILDDDTFLFGEPLEDAVLVSAETTAHRGDIAFASGIDEILRGLEDGWDTELLIRGANLSGGQRQRVRLARALSYGPAVLLAVDPLSAVDAMTESEVATRLRAARDGTTTLIASTSTAIIALADTVHFVENGSVTASGTHPDLLASNTRYRTLVSRTAPDDQPEGASR